MKNYCNLLNLLKQKKKNKKINNLSIKNTSILKKSFLQKRREPKIIRVIFKFITKFPAIKLIGSKDNNKFIIIRKLKCNNFDTGIKKYYTTIVIFNIYSILFTVRL